MNSYMAPIKFVVLWSYFFRKSWQWIFRLERFAGASVVFLMFLILLSFPFHITFLQDYSSIRPGQVFAQTGIEMANSLHPVDIDLNDPDVAWSKTFGASGDDIATSIQITQDGGFIVAGYFTVVGDPATSDHFDVFLFKANAQGERQWVSVFGGFLNEFASEVRVTSDGGFIIAGSSETSGSGAEAWVVKTDSDGNQMWESRFGDRSSDAVSYATSVQETFDGSYLVVGVTEFNSSGSVNAWLFKLDSLGNKVWEKEIDGVVVVMSIQQTADGNFILTGATRSWDIWLRKMDALGNAIWQKSFWGPRYDFSFSVQEISDGGFIIAGEYAFDTPLSMAWLIKTDAAGNLIWKRFFEKAEFATSAQETVDGNFIVAGATAAFDALQPDAWLIKIDPNGNEVWEKSFGGPDRDVAHAIVEGSNGSFIVAGFSGSFGAGQSDVWLIKLKGETKVPGDFDGDGKVNFQDFLAFANKFNTRQGDGVYDAGFDLDANGAIDFSDFLIFARNFGK